MSDSGTDSSLPFDQHKIASILPHRYPFLLVDKIMQIDLAQGEAVGLKCLTINESFFQGHFPNRPLMPGVLIIEALAQTGGILIHEQGFNQKTALLLTIKNAKFRRPAFPGDCLLLHVKALHLSAMGGKVKGRAMIGEELAAEAEIGFALSDTERV